MKYYYTYKVQCTAVGYEDYYYYGQHRTNNLDDGYKGSGTGIWEYYKQYPDDYVLIILGFYNNKVELNIAEQELVGDLWKTDPYCLNRMPGGDSSPSFQGHKHTEYAKLTISTKNKAHIHTKEHNKKVSDALKSKPLSEEHKCKISKTLTGKPRPEEVKKKISKTTKGRKKSPLSEEAKRKISESLKGRSLSEERKRNLSEKLTGRIGRNKGRHRVYREDGTWYMSK